MSHRLVPGTGFVVDCFRHYPSATKAWFLTHAHADHYSGLGDGWSAGTVYCSEVTARLVVHMLGVPARLVHALPMDSPVDVMGVQVTLIDANHCCGAVQLLFQLPDGRKVVHSGDMRYSPAMLASSHLQAFRNPDALYLDTTYCNPKYTFPPQEESVAYIVSAIREEAEAAAAVGRSVLFLISTYVIGKERILIEVHRQLGRRIHCSERKLGIYNCLDWPADIDVASMFTLDPKASDVHVVAWDCLGETWPFFRPNYVSMEQQRQQARADQVVGFVPTGWMYEMKRLPYSRRVKGDCAVHLVPYSEHSSFSELREYVKLMRPRQLVPTVGVEGEGADKKRGAMLRHFRLLVDETASKARLLSAFGNQPSAADSDAPRAGRMAACGLAEVRAEAGATPGAARDSTCADADGGEAALVIEEADAVESAENSGEDTPRQAQRAADEGAAASPCSAAAVYTALSCDASDVPALAADVVGRPDGGAPADGCEDEGGDAGAVDAAVAQLLAVLGPVLQPEAARELLEAANGDLAAAINRHYDSGGGSSAVAALPQVDGSGGTPGGGSGSGAKRPAGRSGGTPGGRAKRAKTRAGRDRAQQSITTFFSRAPPPAAAAAAAAVIDAPAAAAAAASEAVHAQADVPVGDAADDADVSTSAAAVEAVDVGEAAGEAPAEVAAAHVAASPRRAKLVLPPPPKLGRPPHALSDEPRGGGISGGSSTSAALHNVAPAVPLAPIFLRGKRGMQAQPAALAAPLAPPAPAAAPDKEVSDGVQSTARDAGGAAVAVSSMDVTAAAARSMPLGGDAASGGGDPASAPRDAVLKDIAEYDPVRHACWSPGQPVPYLHLARTFEALDSTTKRLRIGDALTNCFRSVLALSQEDTLGLAYLSMGKIAPDFEGAELNVGGSTVAAAVVEATGVSRARLRELYNELGDMGDVAQACRQNQTQLQRPAPLTVAGVLAALRAVAAEKGQGAAGRRQRQVLALMRAARETETKYLVRTLVQNLRVGANWRSVVPAMARAVALHRAPAGRPPKSALDAAAASAVAAYHVCPDLSVLVPAMVQGGAEGLEQRCAMTPGVPLKPMLAKISEGCGDALRMVEGADALAEYKYDGVRAQIHLLPEGSVRIFSRNCEDRTRSFPDVVAVIQQAAADGGTRSLVLDAEIVAVERRGNAVALRAFQELSTRARGEVAAAEVKVDVCVFAFDCLYLDGRPLVARPLCERRAALAAALPRLRPGYLQLATAVQLAAAPPAAPPSAASSCPASAPVAAPASALEAARGEGGETMPAVPRAPSPTADTAPALGEGREAAPSGEMPQPSLPLAPVRGGDAASSAEALQQFLLEALAEGAEGLMLKRLGGPGSTYQPSKRSESWVKLKRDYCEGLRDSLDLVPIGAWYGNGRKVGWFSPFLMAAYDAQGEQFQSVCRCMSGFSDAFYREATERLGALRIPGPKPYYATDERPDVWFEPTEVWEIRGADLTISPVHKAAVGRLHPQRGIAMRFPRFVRIRDDKQPEDATDADEVVDLYNKQTRKTAVAGQLLAAARGSGAAAGGPAGLRHGEAGPAGGPTGVAAAEGFGYGTVVEDGAAAVGAGPGDSGGEQAVLEEVEGFWEDV